MNHQKSTLLVLFTAVAVALAPQLVAQELPNGAPIAPTTPSPPAAPTGPQEAPEAFGPGFQYTVFHASRFLPWAQTPTPGYISTTGYIYPVGTTGSYWTQLDLPNGASIDYLYALVYDDTTSGYWAFDFHGYEGAVIPGGASTPSYTSFAADTSANGGYSIIRLFPSPTVVIREWADMDGDGIATTLSYNLSVTAIGSDGAGDLRFWGVAVKWARTISPAPATATFDDVPTDHWAFRFVEALADSGITAGCGGGNYCPDDPITRAEMAVYLAAALGLHWPT